MSTPFPRTGRIMSLAEAKGWEAEIDERIPDQCNLRKVSANGSVQKITIRIWRDTGNVKDVYYSQSYSETVRTQDRLLALIERP